MYRGHMPSVPGGIYGLCNQVAVAFSGQKLTVIDMGSRHGEGFVEFGTHFDCHYEFVEPSPRCLPKIEDVIRENPGRSFRLHSGVMGGQPGSIILNVFESDGDQSANVFSDRQGRYGRSEQVTVPVIPYDEMLSCYDIAKINIEGGEYQLLDDNVFDRFGTFVMEAHNQHVKGKNYQTLIEGLQDKFDIFSYGNLMYKYCFLVGLRV